MLCAAVHRSPTADGLVGDFVEDYPVLCERSGLTALEVQVNAARPGRFINLILKDETDHSTLTEVQLARKGRNHSYLVVTMWVSPNETAGPMDWQLPGSTVMLPLQWASP